MRYRVTINGVERFLYLQEFEAQVIRQLGEIYEGRVEIKVEEPR